MQPVGCGPKVFARRKGLLLASDCSGPGGVRLTSLPIGQDSIGLQTNILSFCLCLSFHDTDFTSTFYLLRIF